MSAVDRNDARERTPLFVLSPINHGVRLPAFRCSSCGALLDSEVGACGKCGRHDRASAGSCLDCGRKLAAEEDCGEQCAECSGGLSPPVLAMITAQFVFYFGIQTINPSLFVHVKSLWSGSAAPIYTATLTTASVLSMVAPYPLGAWAEQRTTHEVYVGLLLTASAAALVLPYVTTPVLFALAWGLLSVPPAARGVRSAYFAKNVPKAQLTRAGMLASAAGLLGGFTGPVVNGAAGQFLNSDSMFSLCAVLACTAHVVSAVHLSVVFLRHKTRTPAVQAAKAEQKCSSCATDLTPREQEYTLRLCDPCYDMYPGGFFIYRRKLLTAFCAIALLLELGLNSTVVATFQPLTVQHFGWGEEQLATVQAAGAGMSIVLAVVAAKYRVDDRKLVCGAACLHLLALALYAWPPLSPVRATIGLLLGLKAQILFMSPFQSLFVQLIGQVRVTFWLTTSLSMAPVIGGAIGTFISPLLLDVAGSWWFLLPGIFPFTAVAMFILTMRADSDSLSRLDAVHRANEHRPG